MNKGLRGAQTELRNDVALYDRSSCGRQRHNRTGTKLWESLTEQPVIGAKVMSPLRNAVSLVDGNQGGLAAGDE
jgi:hypothetical protein